MNTEGSAANQAELERLGVARPPAVAVGGRVVHGWNPRAYAELVGVPYDGGNMLSPDDLRRRLDTVLELTQGAIRGLAAEALQVKYPGRDRTAGNLAFHVFRIGAAFLDCLEQGRFPGEWFNETAPEGMSSGGEIAAYGSEARHRLAAWFATAPVESYGETAHTYYGDCTVHELLERTTWHAAQHMRQIYFLLEEHRSLTAPVPDPAVYEGLPIPAEMW